MCLYPKLIKNKKYTANKKNGGNIPIVKDMRVLYVPAGCGRCMECRKQKARQWQVRIAEEIRKNRDGLFVTYTFSDEELQKLDSEIKGLTGYERDNEISRIAVRRYTERWRKKYKKTIRHWFVTEIGTKETERLHIHGIVWTKEKEDIVKIWKYGRVDIGRSVNAETVNYIVKYISKVDEKHREYISKVYASKGLGKEYMDRRDCERNKYKEKNTNETYTTRNGMKLALPIYYRNKIYNEEEREKLWINKLDEKIRWVNGIKVDISNGDEEYFKVLGEARKKNKRLGYGKRKIDWDKKKYENDRRNIKKMERVQRLYKKEARAKNGLIAKGD